MSGTDVSNVTDICHGYSDVENRRTANTDSDRALDELADDVSDVPGKTTLEEHHTELMPDTKLTHCTPYCLSPEKTKVLKNELGNLRQQLSHTKCYFTVAEVDYLGHCVGLGRVQLRPKQVQAVIDFPAPHTVEFCELLYSYGLVQQVHDVTHDAGSTLDVVCSRGDLPCLSVDVHEIGLSEHHLLGWTAPFCRQDPLYLTADHRLWRSFSLDAFLSALQASALCDEQQFQQLDGDALVQLYDDRVTALLNEQIPLRSVSYRVHATSLWFDEECHTAKRALRLSERAARHAGLLSDASSAAAASYHFQRHRYVTLLRQKESAFWSTKCIDAQQLQPRQLWRSFDKLLGRGKTHLSSDTDASALHQFFDDEVTRVWAATPHADEPQVPGEFRMVRGVMAETTSVLLVRVTLQSNLCSGDFLCSLATSLPSGTDMLTGNDLCPSLSADVAVVTRSQPAAIHRKTELQQTTSASIDDVTPSQSDRVRSC